MTSPSTSPERGAIRQTFDFLAPRNASVQSPAREMVERAESELAALEADAQRWRQVERGLFISAAPDPDTGEYEVCFGSGSLDEIANEMIASGKIVPSRRGALTYATPVIDAAISAGVSADASKEKARATD